MSPQIWRDTCDIPHDNREQQVEITRYNMLVWRPTAYLERGQKTRIRGGKKEQQFMIQWMWRRGENVIEILNWGKENLHRWRPLAGAQQIKSEKRAQRLALGLLASGREVIVCSVCGSRWMERKRECYDECKYSVSVSRLSQTDSVYSERISQYVLYSFFIRTSLARAVP